LDGRLDYAVTREPPRTAANHCQWQQTPLHPTPHPTPTPAATPPGSGAQYATGGQPVPNENDKPLDANHKGG